MHKIAIREQPVELYKVLKFEGLAASGGEAKQLIADGQVTLNGVTETRKRKKLVGGDIIAIGGIEYQLVLQPNH